MELGSGRLLLLVLISSSFCSVLVQARTQLHKQLSVAYPPMAEPPSEGSDPPVAAISLPPAPAPRPIHVSYGANLTNSTITSSAPPPLPINEGNGGNSTNSTTPHPFPLPPPLLPTSPPPSATPPPPLPIHEGYGGNSTNFTALPPPLPIHEGYGGNSTNFTALPPLPPPLPIHEGYGGNSTNSTALPPLPPPQGPFSGNYSNSSSTPPPLTFLPPAPAPAPVAAGNSSNAAAVFDVRIFGAVGDGVADDTEAFKAAWDSACDEGRSGIILVPRGYSFKIRSTIFAGPCHSEITLQVDGTIAPPDGPDEWPQNNNKRQWLVFYRANGLQLAGGGLIDGKGEKWWNLPCKPHKGDNGTTLPGPCDSPVALRFFMSSNLTVRGIRIRNSPQFHFRFDNCTNVTIDSISISSPALSPNTDGIHVENSKMVRISNSVIANGDDCVSIGAGTANIDIRNVTCGPSHGISIGSLGSKNTRACVTNITVKDCVIKHSDNGVRIKTWQGGSGAVTGVSFDGIRMDTVRNPIMIDQYYCLSKSCKNQTSAVRVAGVSFSNIRGTYDVRSPPMHFGCSDAVPCTNITLSGVELLPAKGDFIASAFCWNVYGDMQTATIPPASCLMAGQPLSITESDSDKCY